MDVSCKVGVSLYRCGREWTTFTIGVHVMSDGDAVTVQRRICCLVYLCMEIRVHRIKKSYVLKPYP